MKTDDHGRFNRLEEFDEFFIGYEPPMPDRLARFVVTVVIVLIGAIAVWAVTLASGHVPLEGGTFEFGHPRRFAGTVIERPYPALQVDGIDQSETPRLILVAPGKHGADELVHGLDGRHVTLSGTRIQRGTRVMLEIEPGSIVRDASEAMLTATATRAEPFDDGLITLRGEIVDSKCFLGVMVPGAGKTHKDCASLCLRGGIPPALHVQDRSGQSVVLLLTGLAGESIGARALEVAGEAVDVTGTIERQGGWLVLHSDPRTWQPVAP
jgi:hypothetical protein